jgi:tripartite-type tricarboxylate transporter receptor subunit TctC
MKLPRRSFLHLAADAAALPVASRITRAQSCPSRYVRFLVPFPPGDSADPIASVLANRLSAGWGQEVVIEKGGAGGNVGALAAVTAAPDGYTIFLDGAFIAKTPFLYPSSGYDPATDLAPVTKVCEFTHWGKSF